MVTPHQLGGKSWSALTYWSLISVDFSIWGLAVFLWLKSGLFLHLLPKIPQRRSWEVPDTNLLLGRGLFINFSYCSYFWSIWPYWLLPSYACFFFFFCLRCFWSSSQVSWCCFSVLEVCFPFSAYSLNVVLPQGSILHSLDFIHFLGFMVFK